MEEGGGHRLSVVLRIKWSFKQTSLAPALLHNGERAVLRLSIRYLEIR